MASLNAEELPFGHTKRVIAAVHRRHPAPKLGVEHFEVVDRRAGRLGRRLEIDGIVEPNDVVLPRDGGRRREAVGFGVLRDHDGGEDEWYIAPGLAGKVALLSQRPEVAASRPTDRAPRPSWGRNCTRP